MKHAKHTTGYIQAIPPERWKTKLRKTVVGAVFAAGGYALLSQEVGPVWLGAGACVVGGVMIAQDLLRASIPAMRDLVEFVAWAIRKIRGALKNGSSSSP